MFGVSYLISLEHQGSECGGSLTPGVALRTREGAAVSFEDREDEGVALVKKDMDGGRHPSSSPMVYSGAK